MLKTHISKHNISLPKADRTRLIPSCINSGKNYLKATAASLSRSVDKPTQDVTSSREKPSIRVESHPGYFQDGRFVSLLLGTRHLWCSTVSSRAKRRPFRPYKKWEEESPQDHDDHRSSYNESELTLVDDTDDGVLDQDEDVEKTLSERSRLFETCPSYFSSVPVRSQMKFDFLKRGLRLAQEVFFHAARKYLPQVPYLQGPHEVQLGRTELERLVLSGFDSKEVMVGSRRIYRYQLSNILDDITTLRNTVCHFGRTSTHCMSLSSCDYYIRTVQSLAILFEDEKGAFRARRLRDRFAARVEKIRKQHEQMLMLTELPFARPWEGYIQEVFEDFIQNGVDEDEYYEGVPSLMLQAARGWDRRRPEPSNGEWLPPSIREQLD
ncbi:hypothetical protein F5Y04DRAFT_292359 [Hypomontagnella monticulosa]|nr:hypothetical protein F5Y04DRAFT_292359 [Hypomontagnella monticulosa]